MNLDEEDDYLVEEDGYFDEEDSYYPHLTPPHSPSFGPRTEYPYKTPGYLIEQLHTAVLANDLKTFKLLLHLCLNVGDGEFEICELFDSVMMEAVDQDNAEIVSELMNQGFPIRLIPSKEATHAKAMRILHVFLRHGWDINEPPSRFQHSVLAYAVRDEDITEWLLDHGADPNRQTYFYPDSTPMSFAVQEGSFRTIELMFSRGGNFRKGKLLHHAVDRVKDDRTRVLALLLDKGALLNEMYEHHPDSWSSYPFSGYGTPLHKAAQVGNQDAVQYLLDRGAATDIKDHNGQTPEDCAKTFRHAKVAKLLRSFARK